MTTQTDTQYGYLQSPTGLLEIAATNVGLTHILFVENKRHPESSSPVVVKAKSQLAEYFDGQRTTFELPLAPKGTAFQQRVWQALSGIGYGQTCSYADIAQSLGNPNAVRAVGAANGRNPLSIVIPCHRVIGKNGKLTGYAGGLSRKAWLLTLESGQNTTIQSTFWDE